jgi:hypothetical protein
MPTPLVTQHYPDDFQVVTFNALDRYGSGATDGGSTASYAIFYADRDVAVDSIVIAIAQAGASGSSLRIFKTTTGTAASPATPLFNGTTALTTAAQAGDATAGFYTQTLVTPANDTNIVRAGNWIGVILAGTLTNFRGQIQIRLRSRIA